MDFREKLERQFGPELAFVIWEAMVSALVTGQLRQRMSPTGNIPVPSEICEQANETVQDIIDLCVAHGKETH